MEKMKSNNTTLSTTNRKDSKYKHGLPPRQISFNARGFLHYSSLEIPVNVRCFSGGDPPLYVEVTPKRRTDTSVMIMCGRVVVLRLCALTFRCAQIASPGYVNGRACLRLSPGQFFEEIGGALRY